jgi:hypothetical protein
MPWNPSGAFSGVGRWRELRFRRTWGVSSPILGRKLAITPAAQRQWAFFDRYSFNAVSVRLDLAIPSYAPVVVVRSGASEARCTAAVASRVFRPLREGAERARKGHRASRVEFEAISSFGRAAFSTQLEIGVSRSMVSAPGPPPQWVTPGNVYRRTLSLPRSSTTSRRRSTNRTEPAAGPSGSSAGLVLEHEKRRIRHFCDHGLIRKGDVRWSLL